MYDTDLDALLASADLPTHSAPPALLPPAVQAALKSRTKPVQAVKRTPFMELLTGLEMRGFVGSAVLPPCPCCAALADSYYDERYTQATQIAHDCLCATTTPGEYARGLKQLWSRRHALPIYLRMLPVRYRDLTLDTLERTDGNAEAVAAALAGRNLYLHGLPGRGKTAVAALAGRLDAQAGLSVAYYSGPELTAAFRAAERGEGPQPDFEHWDTVFIDDLDKIRPTPLGFEAMYRVTEHFYANKKRLIVTSQLPPSATAKAIAPATTEDSAVAALASRLAAGARLTVEGHDRRFMSE